MQFNDSFLYDINLETLNWISTSHNNGNNKKSQIEFFDLQEQCLFIFMRITKALHNPTWQLDKKKRTM